MFDYGNARKEDESEVGNMEQKKLFGAKRNSLLKGLIISYLTVIVIFIGVSTFLQFRATSVVKEQSEAIYENTLNVLSKMIDNEVNTIRSVAVDLAMGAEIDGCLENRYGQSGDGAMAVRRLRDKFSSTKSNAWSIENVYLYRTADGRVISDQTAASADLFFQVYQESLMLSCEEWETILLQTETNGYRVLPNKDGANTLLYLLPVPITKGEKEKEGVLAVEVAKEVLGEKIREYQENNDVKIEVTTEQGEPFSRAFLGQRENDYKEISLQSDSSGWRYHAYVPVGIFNRQENLMAVMAVASIAAATIMGAAAAAYSLKKNYMPIRKLVASLQSAMEKDSVSGNEAEYLWESFEKLVNRQREDKLRLNGQLDEMKGLFLGQLFRGRVISDEAEREYYSLFHLEFVHEAFVAAKIFVKEKKMEDAMLLGDGIWMDGVRMFRGGKVKEGRTVYYLIDAAPFALEEIIAGFGEFYEKTGCCVVLSAMHQGSDQIPHAYSEVLGTDAYARSAKEGGVAVYTDKFFRTAAIQESYSRMEKKIIHAVLAKQGKEARICLDEIWDFFYEEGPVPVGEVKFLIMGLFHSILKESRDGNMRRIILDTSKRLRMAGGIDAMEQIRRIALDALADMCEKVQAETPEENQIKKQVLQYIEENFSREDLNVETICRNLNHSVSSVMKAFSKGEGVLYYLNERRILEAKRLILEYDGTMSMGQIAREIGYASQNTFIRVFKKYEGITPGKFSGMVRNMGEEHTADT